MKPRIALLTALVCFGFLSGCGEGTGRVSVGCTPDATRCDGHDILKCNADGVSWSFYMECAKGCAAGECTTGGGCAPSCGQNECGDDGCGGSCGTCPETAPYCEDGICTEGCTPDCSGVECGDDGCGGSCGSCDAGEVCGSGMCSCVPDCADADCGGDGCGGSCGSCPPGVVCIDGACNCAPDCAWKECGSDGCGGSCGSCTPSAPDCIDFKCTSQECIPNCIGKNCGSNGCGGSCGTCPCAGCDPAAIYCEDGLCQKQDVCACKCIFDCFDACPNGDQACYQNCVNSATIEGQMAYNNLIVCLDQSGYFNCDDYDELCLEETFDACMDPYYECFHGNLTCGEMYLCILSCPEGEAGQVCSQNCFAEGSVEALHAWDDFLECLELEDYFECPNNDPDCEADAWDACKEDFVACAHGTKGCSDILTCMETCGPTDQVCSLACVINGTVEAQEQWDAITDCIMEECGWQADPACEGVALEGACYAAYSACVGN